MNILVTGNQGYLGSVLTSMLKDRGHLVHGLDNGMQSSTLVDPSGMCAPDSQFVDPWDTPDVRYDVVYHLAAISNDPMGEVDEGVTRKVNVTLVDYLCRKYPDARHVLASSASVYGAIPSDDIADEMYPLNPLTAYARSKVEAESVVRRHWDYSILRMGTLWGASPNFRRDIVVNAFFHEAHLTGSIVPKAQARRPMLHVLDAARTMILAGYSGLWTNKVVNVGAENTTVSDIARAVSLSTGATVDWSESKEPDKRDYAMDTHRYESISAELGNVLRVGDPGAMSAIRATISDYGKPYPTRLEQLRAWLDKERNS
jgi:nucleoside-diphosphate-sugar epimerase